MLPDAMLRPAQVPCSVRLAFVEDDGAGALPVAEAVPVGAAVEPTGAGDGTGSSEPHPVSSPRLSNAAAAEPRTRLGRTRALRYSTDCTRCGQPVYVGSASTGEATGASGSSGSTGSSALVTSNSTGS